MNTGSILVVLGLMAGSGALFLLIRSVVRAYLRFHGRMVVTCPETKQPAGVELDAKLATWTGALGRPVLRLHTCSRWPERQGCGQVCLDQIEESPQDCLVRTMLTRWYEGKSCVYCRKPIGPIHWSDHKPALMSPERKTIEWREVRAERIPEALSTHRPVCWNCHIAESFRREHPDLVVDRPWRGQDHHRHV